MSAAIARIQRKVVDLPTLLAKRQAAQRAKKTVVHCHGCFDIVHPGHVRYLQFAKQQGDILIVSLTGDPHVGKGEGRPYVPQELRAENLAALQFVDLVYINPDPTASDLLATLKPDLYIKGREYEQNQHPGFLKERHTVEGYGGRVIFSSGDVIYSSSYLIDNYAQHLDLEQEKISLFCARYQLDQPTLLALLEGILDRPMVVVGDMVLDRYQHCDASDLAGDGPMMSLVPLEKRDFLGGAAMVARHLADLGGQVTFITSAGTDEASDAAVDSLESAGLQVLALRNRKRLATKTRYVVDNQKLFLVDESPSTPTDSTDVKWLIEQVAQRANGETSLVLYDAGLGVFTEPVVTSLVKSRTQADGFGCLCAGTAGSRGRLIRLTNADLIVTSERGLRGAMRDYEQGLNAVSYQFMSSTRNRALLMPSGKRGVLTFDARVDVQPGGGEGWEGKLRSEYLSSPTNGVIDRLGFDEALLGVAAGMMAAGGNVQQTAYVALAAAMMEARQAGHQVIDAQQLRRFIESREELAPREAVAVRV